MKSKIHSGRANLTQERAEALAKLLNHQDEEGWTYKAQHGQNFSNVLIFDEEGNEVGFL